MTRQFHLRPVIQSRSSQRTIVHAKPCDTDDVKWNVSSSTQASDVACVRWNLWFDERDGKHANKYRLNTSYRTYQQTIKRNDELRMKVSSFLLRGRSASNVFVRRWKVRVTCWFGLSLLRGLLGSAAPAFLSALLASAFLSSAALLSTFFSCHSFYVLLLSSLVCVFSS